MCHSKFGLFPTREFLQGHGSYTINVTLMNWLKIAENSLDTTRHFWAPRDAHQDVSAVAFEAICSLDWHSTQLFPPKLLYKKHSN